MKKKKSKKEALIEEKVEPAPISRVLAYNKPEWHLMGIGVFFSALHGCVPIFFAFIIGEILGVCVSLYTHLITLEVDLECCKHMCKSSYY